VHLLAQWQQDPPGSGAEIGWTWTGRRLRSSARTCRAGRGRVPRYLAGLLILLSALMPGLLCLTELSTQQARAFPVVRLQSLPDLASQRVYPAVEILQGLIHGATLAIPASSSKFPFYPCFSSMLSGS